MRPVVLVTGAAGLIGRHALPGLVAAGFEVHACSRSSGASGSVTWHGCDLLRPGEAESLIHRVRPSYLLHLAWTTSHGEFWHSPLNAAWEAASRDLITAFARAGGHRVVAAGTCAEYDWRSGAVPLPDFDPLSSAIAPATDYGRAKDRLHRWLAGSGLDYAWGRVFFLFGEGEDQRRLVPSIALPLLAGREAATGPGSLVRDFLDSRDAGALFAALVAGGLNGPVNIASGEGHEIGEVATMIARAAGRPDLLRIGALPVQPGNPPRLVGQIGDLRKRLGLGRTIALEDGIRHTVDGLRRVASLSPTAQE